MKLSLEFLYLRLKKDFPGISVLGDEWKQQLCASARLAAGAGVARRKDLLYVLTPGAAQDFKEHGAEAVPLLLTEADSGEFPGFPQIVLREGQDIFQAFNTVLGIFQTYQEWADGVRSLILENKSLDEILEYTGPVVNNPMYIADLSFKMLAKINMDLDEISVIWRYQIKYDYLPYNIMMDLVGTGELDLLNRRTDAFYLDSKSFHHPFISKTIRYHGKTQGHFFIIEIYHNLTQCDIEIAEYLGELLSMATYDNRNYLTISGFYHEHFMVDVLERTLTDTSLIRNQLKPLGWELYGEYAVFAMHMPEDEEAMKRYVIAFLLEGFQAQAFLYREHVVVIYAGIGKRRRDIIHNLERLTALFNRWGALSEDFSAFDHLSYYFAQACFALEQGERTGLKERFCLYEEWFYAHMNQAVEPFMPCFYPAQCLRDYDREHNSQYCLTLFMFLENERNAVKTAQVLFLHRNTLRYRLEKIQELIKVDLEHPQIRARLLQSLYPIVAAAYPAILLS